MSFTYINELLSSPSTSELFSNPSYPLYLSVETLTKAAEKQRSSKRAPYSIPRPPNPFFIFRKNYTAKMKQEAERSSTTDTSKNVGKIWKEQGPKVKKLFQALSLLAKKNHNLKYPDYKYQPKSKTLKQLTFCHVDPGTGNKDEDNEEGELNNCSDDFVSEFFSNRNNS
ncbi:7623_t:CDS:2 [Diversispora eburnea]|uniref:7623_t:CDS:1 n=1 Tax=Diversispora eburnea TaxID=1213867 RepID=A0A9N8W422_9GLOM|nr:7623_t:CDS:2 [Diversispora eburnea]